MNAVDMVLIRFYRREVIAGFTSAGWPVVRDAKSLEIIEGGVGGTVTPVVVELLKAHADVVRLVEQMADHLNDRDMLEEEQAVNGGAES